MIINLFRSVICSRIIICGSLLIVGLNLRAQSIPTITSISKSTSGQGEIITLSGAGFSPTPTGNIVTFGAVRAQVLTASAQQLTVRVPAGATYGPITVTRADNGLSASSSSFFLPRFYGQSGSARFAPRVDLPAGEMPAYLSLADLDLDGKPDILATDYGRTSLNILQNISEPGSIQTGSFKPKFDLGTGNNTYGLVVGDLDGDGKQDVVVSNRGSSSIAIFRNISATGTLSAGSFAPAVNIPVQSTPMSVHIGDIEGDGKPELLIAHNEGDRISILRNLSSAGSLTSSSFAAPVLFNTGSVARYLAIGDLDADSKADVVVVNQASGELQLFKNTSTPGRIDAGSLTAAAVFAAGGMIRTVNIGDLDGDGRPDLMVTNYRDTDKMHVLQNTTSPGVLNAASFATPFTLTVGQYAKNLSVGDLNGDGKPDLAIVCDEGSNNNVFLYYNTHATGTLSAASFSSPHILTAGLAPFGVVIGDLDGDGRPELVISAEASERINIFRNETPLAEAPVITTVSPVRAAPGATVTISGSGFESTATRNVVHFGATRATVSSGNASSLNVIVPKGASYGPLTVTHPGNHLSAFSPKFFEPTFAGKPVPLNLSTRTDLALPNQPGSIASGDLDGDGRADLVSLSASGQLSIHRNISTPGTLEASSFATRIDLPAGVDPRGLTIIDLDGDGWKDIAFADQGSGRLSVFRNRGLAGVLGVGSFDDRFDILVTGKVRSLVAGDLDRDGRPDLIFTRVDQDSVSVIRNLSRMPGSFNSSSFSSPFNYYVGPNPHALAIGDLDGDGRPDLAVALESASWVAVLRNIMPIGSIDRSGFPAPVMLRTAAIGVSGGAPTHVAIGDLDGDGKADIIAPNHVEGRIGVFRNVSVSGSLTIGSFSSLISIPAASGFEPFQVALSDMDGDGKPDLTVLGPAAGKLRVLQNLATPGNLSEGSFKELGMFGVGVDPRGSIVGDLDNDGQPDMAVVNRGSHSLSVLRLNQQQMPACIPAFDPFPAAIYSRADSLRLDAGTGYTTYAWNTGATGASIHVKYSGIYRVTVTLAGICSSSDSVLVQFPDTVGLHLPVLQASCGDSVDLPLRATAFRHILSMQGSLRWDANELEFVRIADFGPSRLQLKPADFGTAQTAAGKFSFSWVDPENEGASIPDTAILFKLRFRVTGKVLRTSAISLSNDPTPMEFIDGRTEARKLVLNNGSVDIRCTIRIAGQIRTPGDQPVRNVQVILSSTGTPQSAMTDSSGFYHVDVPVGTYTLTPAKAPENYRMNGVSTIDLVYIQAHILQRTLLTSAFKVIAADANRSESVTSADILMIRRLILGADTTLPGGLWAFVDGDQTFISQLVPFPFRPTKTFTNLAADTFHRFYAIKIGDVNEDRNPLLDQASSGDTLRLTGEWVDTDDGYVDLRIRSRAVSGLMGWQTTLGWDPRQLQLLGANNIMFNLGVGDRWKEEGSLTVSWHDPQATGLDLTDGVDWISLRFRKLPAFQQALVRISGDRLTTEVFNKRFQSMGLRLDQTADRPHAANFRVFPNPVRQDLQLTWTMEKDGPVRIRMTDPLGRLLFDENRWAKAGPQLLSRRLPGISPSGTYMLTLEAEGQISSKQVIISGY